MLEMIILSSSLPLTLSIPPFFWRLFMFRFFFFFFFFFFSFFFFFFSTNLETVPSGGLSGEAKTAEKTHIL